jgi:hypothetical protein
MLTEEKLNKNLEIFKEKLEEIAPNNKLIDNIGDKLRNATFSPNGSDSLVGDGTLLNTILRKLTPMAIKLNELLPEDKRIERDSLVKVCLLHQIAKAVKLIPNDNEWEIEKRGIYYKYDNELPSIRTGLHSLAIAQEADIKFTVEEVEAMTINDKDINDDMTRFHSSPFANIIRMANEMIYISES